MILCIPSQSLQNIDASKIIHLNIRDLKSRLSQVDCGSLVKCSREKSELMGVRMAR